MTYHKQCILRKGTTITVSWIPEKFAHPGKHLKLKDDGKWVDGWVVEVVGTRLDSTYVENRSQEYKKHRERTDI